MKVIILCEESQVVCKAFRERGIEAYSCDIQDCSGGHPEWHIKGDAIEVMRREKWDLQIGHPVCKRLANSGVLRLYKDGKKANGIDPVKWKEMEDGAYFFMKFLNSDCEHIATENPVQHSHAGIPMYTQTIQPLAIW